MTDAPDASAQVGLIVVTGIATLLVVVLVGLLHADVLLDYARHAMGLMMISLVLIAVVYWRVRDHSSRTLLRTFITLQSISIFLTIPFLI